MIEGTAPADAGTAPASGADTSNQPWFSGVDAETSGYLSNRGWDKLDAKTVALEAIKAHRNAEQKLGAPADRLLRIPTDVNDKDGWDKIHTALGRPKDASGYDFTGLNEAGEGFTNFAREFAYKNNLPKGVGEALAKEFVAYATNEEQRETAEQTANLEREKTELKKEWGFNFQANLSVAQAAAQKLGIDPGAVAALESQTGYASVMKMFQKIGQAIGEDRFVTSTATGKVMTREGAQARIAELKSDREWVNKYLNGDSGAKREMEDLIRISASGG